MLVFVIVTINIKELAKYPVLLLLILILLQCSVSHYVQMLHILMVEFVPLAMLLASCAVTLLITAQHVLLLTIEIQQPTIVCLHASTPAIASIII